MSIFLPMIITFYCDNEICLVFHERRCHPVCKTLVQECSCGTRKVNNDIKTSKSAM